MALKVPRNLHPAKFFKTDGTPLRNEFPFPLRDALHYESSSQIPLTQTPYMIFGDIGIPCNSPSFSDHFHVCNKLFIALQKLCVALAVSAESEKSKLFEETAKLFDALPEFPWPAPDGSVYPTFSDNRVKIAAALHSLALFFFGDNKTQVSKLDEIIVLTETAEEFKCFTLESLHDLKYGLLSTRACTEADRFFQLCQTDATPENVDSFVKNGASAIFLREKIKSPSKELSLRIDELLETLEKYHADAYRAFLKSCSE